MRHLGGAIAYMLVLVLALDATFAAEESCTGRCNTFDPMTKCQCDSMCVYYDSCCKDFESVCPKKVRGDTFETPFVTTDEPSLELETSNPPTTTVLPPSTTLKPPPTARPDPDAVPCSARPFDAFLQLKNGSIYAFRGDYFFEMDERAVVPGYPKLIQDVWGIPGPIDAAFTRNCQGKTYIFKGSQYWRFEDDVLDEDYPREISVGFEKVPDYVSAAFAIPAPGHHGKEKVYFFKGEQYYQYEFKHQPSHEECVRMSRSSPSAQFTHYTDLYCDNWGDLFTQLFGGPGAVQGHKGPRFISKDWVGIRPPIDAAMVGRLYIGPKPTSTPAVVPAPGRRRSNRRRRPSSRRRGYGGRPRHSRSLSFFEDLFGDDYPLGDYDYGADYAGSLAGNKAKPVQNVYFFKRDQYYRVDLQTKRIDFASPPYPRSIAKYWLGCRHEETALPDETLAEKK